MGALMIIIAILVGFLIIGAILSDGTEPKSEYKHRFKSRSQSSSPKALPWFDKDYLKRKREEEYRKTGIDI